MTAEMDDGSLLPYSGKLIERMAQNRRRLHRATTAQAAFPSQLEYTVSFTVLMNQLLSTDTVTTRFT